MAAQPFKFLQKSFDANSELAAHRHKEAQILFARSGTLDLNSEQKLFLLPSSRLAWIPPGRTHAIRFRSATQLRTAYVPGTRARSGGDKTRIFQASPLFREMLLRLVEDKELTETYRTRLENLLLQEIALLPSEEFNLKLPSDKRGMRVATAVIENPDDKKRLDEWAKIAACSPKTLSRIFSGETDLTFQLWRRHARLLAGLDFLEKGFSITETAHEVGFSTSSAFTEAFRLTFGYPPSAR